MKFLPYSNGVRRANLKKKRSPKEKAKLFCIIFISLLVIGMIFQNISNFIDGERIREKVDYTTVDDLRMDYRISGEGKYSIVFDGALGATLEAWSPIVEQLKDDDVQTFVYNRRGYGYSNSGSRRTPEEQAQDLKILLRKSGMSEPYILVGEGYGSLVLTSFEEQFKDSVEAVILIDPINEDTIKSKSYARSQGITKFRRFIENIGSQIGVTALMDKLNLDINLTDLESALPEDTKEEFLAYRTKSKYTSAVYNELTTLTKGDSNSQKEGVFSGIPYYLITKLENDPLAKLGSSDLTTTYVTKCEKDFLALNDQDNVLNAIRDIIKKLNNK